MRQILQSPQGTNCDMQNKVSFSFVPLTYVEPHETYVVQGRRELQCATIECYRQNSVGACAWRRMLPKKVGDQLRPFVGDNPIAVACATGHSLVD
ncbi:hypothetical protein GCM10007857_19870 [Bradyrhizobium iriomotense]|uniref:Uncharacterized protein n=1 Tax=Bradyrhizobium iriomotense TaxID=441950 RepID=A0ABQ6AZF8_9BRAD|nr:hypothetical protein GCM10007857_19870 [Bradyrhizobium iriomotense]